MAAAKACASELGSAATIAKKVLVRRLVRRIAVETESIVIEVRLQALWEEASDELVVPISVPAKLKRCGLAMRLIMEGKGERKAGQPDPRLIALLMKGQRWFRELSSGESPSIGSMARGPTASRVRM